MAPTELIAESRTIASSDASTRPIRVAMLGAGGLGRAACRIIAQKRELRLTAMCDSKGVLVSPDGLDAERLASGSGDLVDSYAGVDAPQLTRERCEDPLGRIIERAGEFDGAILALPNIRNEFIPNVIERFIAARHSSTSARDTGLIFVDVLKRTAAVKQLFTMEERIRDSRTIVLAGCGATPGLLTAAAVLAAQSFITVEKVDIWWGVGIANWDAYKATIREDIAHLPGVGLDRARAMTDAEVEAFLDARGGVLELHHMEHADDVLLARAGVVDSEDQVEVGGVMDTRHARKPVSTTMTLTGITYEGKRASHRFILGDETTMAANVIGPALGYLKRGVWLRDRGLFGVFGSTDVMPMVVR